MAVQRRRVPWLPPPYQRGYGIKARRRRRVRKYRRQIGGNFITSLLGSLGRKALSAGLRFGKDQLVKHGPGLAKSLAKKAGSKLIDRIGRKHPKTADVLSSGLLNKSYSQGPRPSRIPVPIKRRRTLRPSRIPVPTSRR